MSNPTRARIQAAFDEELRPAPVPPGLRPVSIRAAVHAPRPRNASPTLLAAVAAVALVALVATLVIGSHVLRTRPTPSQPNVSPATRSGAAVVYDQAHGVMVLFGGRADSLLNDTWTWDGKHWSATHPAVRPAPRMTFAMAYDEARHNVVLFGGLAQVSAGKAGLQPVDDTWIWDGSTWREIHPLSEPAFGYDLGAPTMGYDPISKTVLMYGHTRSTSEAMTGIRAETWSWNGSDWSQVGSAGGPTTIGTMVRDRTRVLIVAESASMVDGRYVMQTWTWDGSTWKLVNPKVNLPPVVFVSAAYDPERAQVVLLSADTWVWDGSTWARKHPSLQPPVAGYMAYIPSLHAVVSWGDITGRLDYGTFAWDGADWKTIVPGPAQAGAKGGDLGVMTPDQAATLIRATVKDAQPILLPAHLPDANWDATVYPQPDGFTIRYQSDQRDKSIELGIMVANPPPGGAHSKDSMVRFRNALPLKYSTRGYAEYFVYDTTSPTSVRWLMWIEPGTMTNPQLAGPGVPYFLAADGLTDAEFWQVANSLR
jgi:hypothetical protein